MTIAGAVSWLEERAKFETRWINSLSPGNMSTTHSRARLCVAKLWAVQAGALRHGYRFPELTE